MRYLEEHVWPYWVFGAFCCLLYGYAYTPGKDVAYRLGALTGALLLPLLPASLYSFAVTLRVGASGFAVSRLTPTQRRTAARIFFWAAVLMVGILPHYLSTGAR